MKQFLRHSLAVIALASFASLQALAQQSTVGSGSPSPTTQARPNPGASMSAPTTAPNTPPPSTGTGSTANTGATTAPAADTGATTAPAATTGDNSATSTTPAESKPDASSSSLPQTTIFPDNGVSGTVNDPLLQPGELPGGKVSLIGGMVTSIDNVRNRLTLQTFHGPKMKFIFDDRTKVFKDGTEVTQMAIHKGDRLYVDSQLNQGKLFVRRMNIRNTLNPADASGQIVSFDRKHGLVVLNDQLSGRPVSFRLADAPVIHKQNGLGTLDDLQRGTLVQVQFVGGKARGIAHDIKVLAAPGTAYTFFGRVTHIDLRSGLVALENKSDNKIYDITFRPSQVSNMDDLTIGADTTITATFNGRNYQAQTIEVSRTASAAAADAARPGAKDNMDKPESDDADFKDNDKQLDMSNVDDKDSKKHQKDKHEKKQKKDKKDKDDSSDDEPK